MEVDPLVELRGLHEPPATLGTILADGVVALSIGLLCAWLVVQIVKLLSAREVSPKRRALQQLGEIKRLDGSDGLAARARLLLDLGRALPDEEGDVLVRVDRHLGGFLTDGAGKEFRDALYRPYASVDLVQFDNELETSLQRAAS